MRGLPERAIWWALLALLWVLLLQDPIRHWVITATGKRVPVTIESVSCSGTGLCTASYIFTAQLDEPATRAESPVAPWFRPKDGWARFRDGDGPFSGAELEKNGGVHWLNVAVALFLSWLAWWASKRPRRGRTFRVKRVHF